MEHDISEKISVQAMNNVGIRLASQIHVRLQFLRHRVTNISGQTMPTG